MVHAVCKSRTDDIGLALQKLQSAAAEAAAKDFAGAKSELALAGVRLTGAELSGAVDRTTARAIGDILIRANTEIEGRYFDIAVSTMANAQRALLDAYANALINCVLKEGQGKSFAGDGTTGDDSERGPFGILRRPRFLR